MVNAVETIKSLMFTARELKQLTIWPDQVVEDYINIAANLIHLAEWADRGLEEIPTHLLEGSVPFVDDGFITEDNIAFFWDKTNQILKLLKLQVGGTQVSTWDENGLYTSCPGITFEESPVAPAASLRSLRWNEQDRCLEYISPLGNTVQIGQEQWDIGVNKTGGQVLDGRVVYASGIQGGRLTFDYADASIAAKCALVGVVTAPTDDNQEGPVTTFGRVHDLDTSAWIEGTKLYIAADATGVLTDTAPPVPNFRIWVATVLYQHPTQGAIFVFPRIDHANGITFTSLDILTSLTAAEAKFGDLVAGDFSEFEVDGTYKANGAATVYSDLQGSALDLKTVGVRITTSPANNSIAFSTLASLTDYAYGNYQLQHSWKMGSSVFPHIHWEQAQNTVPNFLIQYRWQAQLQAKTTAWTNYLLPGLATAYPGGTLNQISYGPALVPPVGASLSDILELRVVRDTANASGLFAGPDPYTADVEVVFIDIHIEEDTLGSRSEYTK